MQCCSSGIRGLGHGLRGLGGGVGVSDSVLVVVCVVCVHVKTGACLPYKWTAPPENFLLLGFEPRPAMQGVAFPAPRTLKKPKQ